MEIDRDMNMESLREMMGTEATPEDARAMRDVLLSMRCADTDELTEQEWLHAMTAAMTAIAERRMTRADASRLIDGLKTRQK